MGKVVELRQCAPSICGSTPEGRPALGFNYDYTGALSSYFDGASGGIAYERSPAGQITSVKNLTYADQYNTPNLVTNVMAGFHKRAVAVRTDWPGILGCQPLWSMTQ